MKVDSHTESQDKRTPTFEFSATRPLNAPTIASGGFWMRLDLQVFCMCAVSLMLSLLAWFTSDGINPDGILYVETAEAFVSNGYATAMTMYDWPFFSILIGSWAKLSGTSYLLSAQLISSLLLAAFCGGFIAVCREVFPDPRVGWGALVTISTMLGLNEYRDYVIRDFGFWTFLIFSTWCLARALKAPTWGNLFGFQLCIGIALIFRIEAVVFAALGPFVLFLSQQGWKAGLLSYLKCNLPIAASLAAALALVGVDRFANGVSSSKLEEVIWYANLETANVRVANFRGNWMEDEIAKTIFVTGSIGFLILKAAAKMGVGHIALCLYGLLPHSGKLRMTISGAAIVWMLGIATTIAFYFLLNKPFLQGRFAMPIAMFSLILISGIFTHVFNQLYSRKITSVLLGLLFFITLADAFIQTGNSKHHLIEAAHWVKKESSAQSKVLSNHAMLDFYSGRKAFYRDRHNSTRAGAFPRLINHVDDYDFLMIREKGAPLQTVTTLQESGKIDLLRTFEGTKQGRVVKVFAVVH